MRFISPNQVVLSCRGLGETTQAPGTSTGTGWGTAIGGMITGATYLTTAIIGGIATAKAFEAREEQFELELELQKKQWEAERQARMNAASAALEQAVSGGGQAAGTSSTLLTLGLLAGGLVLIYKLA